MNNYKWMFFHTNLMGYRLVKNGEYYPKYLAYWLGYNSVNILDNKSVIKAIKNV